MPCHRDGNMFSVRIEFGKGQGFTDYLTKLAAKMYVDPRKRGQEL